MIVCALTFLNLERHLRFRVIDRRSGTLSNKEILNYGSYNGDNCETIDDVRLQIRNNSLLTTQFTRPLTSPRPLL